MSNTLTGFLVQGSGREDAILAGSESIADYRPKVGYWVRLKSNADGSTYVSTAATDTSGKFSILLIPDGSYQLQISQINPRPAGVDWQSTGNGNVPIVAGNFPTQLPAGTTVAGDFFAVNPPTGKVTDYGGMVWNAAHPTFGTLGGTATQNRQAIQAAIAQATSVGGEVFIPYGTWLIDAELQINAGITVGGNGMGQTTIRANGAFNVLRLQAGSLTTVLRDLTLDGNLLANYGIFCDDQGGRYLRMWNVQMKGCTGTPGYGFANTNHSFQMFWFGCIVGGGLGIPDQNTLGLYLKGLCEGSYFYACQFILNNSGQVWLDYDGVQPIRNLGFFGCQIGHTTTAPNVAQDNFKINNASAINIDGCYMECNISGSHDLHIVGSAPSYISMKDTFSNGNGSGGTGDRILIDAGADGTVLTLEKNWSTGYGAEVNNASTNATKIVKIQNYENGRVDNFSVTGFNPTSPNVTSGVGWSFDPVAASTGSGNLTAGTLYCTRIMMPSLVKVTNILLYLTVSGVGLTASQNFVGLYDSAGTLLSASADLSGAGANQFGQAPGLLTIPLTAAQMVGSNKTAFPHVWVVVLVNFATTSPQFRCSAAPNQAVNHGPINRFGTILTLQTSLPTPITTGSIAGSPVEMYAELS